MTLVHAFIHECSQYSWDSSFKSETIGTDGLVSWSGKTPDGLMTGLAIFTEGEVKVMWSHMTGTTEVNGDSLKVSLECYLEGQGKEEVDSIVDSLRLSDPDFNKFMEGFE